MQRPACVPSRLDPQPRVPAAYPHLMRVIGFVFAVAGLVLMIVPREAMFVANKLRPGGAHEEPPARIVEGWRIIGAIIFVLGLAGFLLG